MCGRGMGKCVSEEQWCESRVVMQCVGEKGKREGVRL